MPTINVREKINLAAFVLFAVIALCGCKKDSGYSGSQTSGLVTKAEISDSSSGAGKLTNPEPLSAALFGLGLATLAMRKVISKRRARK